MKALNLRLIFSTLIVALVSFSSCNKKNEDTTPPHPMVGAWEGNYDGKDVYYSFVLKANGTMTVWEGQTKDAASKGSGTWKFEGQTFTAIYSYNDNADYKFNVAAKISDDFKTMSGGYGVGIVSADDGEYFMEKK
jgi:hypothetical protein